MNQRPEERCFVCDEPTGRAGRSDDSIYWADTGPWCLSCSSALRQEVLDDCSAEIGSRIRSAETAERERCIASIRGLLPQFGPQSRWDDGVQSAIDVLLEAED